MPFNKRLSKRISVVVFMLAIFTAVQANAVGKYYYQIKIYHFKTTAQEAVIDSYLKDAYLPALHQMGITQVGVFKPVETDTADRRIYLLISFRNWKAVEKFNTATETAGFAGNNSGYASAKYNAAPYTRVETILLAAFRTRPVPATPKLSAPKEERVYELRSYESATEAYHINKVLMFNSGETDLFDRLDFNPVFYGDVLTGSHMPNLMYMTTFNSKADRDKHWDAFGKDAQWKQLSADPGFQHNVSHADIVFLHPTIYSDF